MAETVARRRFFNRQSLAILAILAISTRPPAPFLAFSLQIKVVIQNRPLRHPTFSTGSPRDFHWVTQGFPLGHPRDGLAFGLANQLGQIRRVLSFCQRLNCQLPIALFSCLYSVVNERDWLNRKFTNRQSESSPVYTHFLRPVTREKVHLHARRSSVLTTISESDPWSAPAFDDQMSR